MPRLSKHEKSGTIGMLQAGMRVSDIERYYNCHTSTIQILRDQAAGTVKDRRRSGQPRITTRSPDAILTAFFILWHYPFCVKIKGTETLCINITIAQLILPAPTSIFWQQIEFWCLTSPLCPETCLRLSY